MVPLTSYGVYLMNFPLSPEHLYDILSDHFMYCEEDSWERNTNLEDMSYEDMISYYTKYHFAITLGE